MMFEKEKNNLIIKKFDEISEQVNKRNSEAADEIREIKEYISILDRDNKLNK